MLGGNDWDCVMTIGPNAWGWMRDTNGQYQKTADDLIDLLMRSRSMGGNLVVNFGPDGTGRMTDHESQVTEALGRWVAANQAAVYDVEPVDADAGGIGWLTGRHDRAYLTVVNRPVNGIARLRFPAGSHQSPSAARLLATGRDLVVRRTDLGFDLDEAVYYDVVVPADFAADRAFVIEIDLVEAEQPSAVREDAMM